MKKMIIPLAAVLSVSLCGGVYALSSLRYSAPKIMAAATDEEIPKYYPDRATGVAADFHEDALTGNITFTAPAKMAGGNTPVGWLKYEVRESSSYPATVLAEGDCEYGQNVSAQVTVTPGYHTVTVYMKNAKGNSSPSYPAVNFWAGPGKPAKVQNVVLTGSGNEITLAWDKVTSPTNNIAFFNPDEVTYKVMRTPGDVTVAESLSANTFTETLPDAVQPTGYRYNVTAVFRGQESDAGQSNGYAIGTATPAWGCALDNINNFDLFSIIDANADNNTWKWPVSGNAPVISSGSGAKDDYLVSPGLMMEAGKLYPVEVSVASYGSNYTEIFEVKGGVMATADGLDVTVIEPTSVNTPDRNAGAVLKGFYMAPADGLNYLAVHAATPSKTYDAFVHSFSVGEGIAAAAPEAVTGLSIESDPDVAPPTAVISFTAPLTAINGASLSSLDRIEVKRGDVLVQTFTAPQPGASLSFSDVVDEKGTYTYTIVAYNASGAGRPVEQPAFVGDYRLHPPYSYDFPDNGWLNNYTVINVNNDNYKWEHDNSYKYAKCSSSSSPGDDYLVLPAIFLRAGYRYTFSFMAKSYYSSDAVPFEVLFGDAPDTESLTVKLGEIKGNDAKIGTSFKEYSYTVDVDTDGEYNFAIRYLSSGSMCILCVNEVKVSEGLNVGAPAAITDLVAVPDFNGALSTVISFTAPSVSMAGAPLTANLSKIEIYRDETLLETLTGVSPGELVEWTDETPDAGYHTYHVTPYAVTKGETASATVYVGVNKPDAPAAATLEETASGTVRISWEAPQLDADGAPVNQALVRYRVELLSIYGEEPVVVEDDIAATEYSYAPVEAGEQKFVSYRVYAVTDGGVSDGYSDTPTIPVGKAHQLPFGDSFAEGTLSYEFLAEREGEYPSEWRVYSDRDLSNLEDQDGNNGVIGMYAPYTTAQSRLITGKIDLTGAMKPVFSVWYRAVKDCECSIGLDVREVGASDFTRLTLVPAWGADVAEGWIKVSAPLDDYIGKTVQLAVYGSMKAHNYLFFDNLRVATQHPVNLRANAISAPARMYPGEDAAVAVTFQNLGDNTVQQGACTVDLYRNGLKVQTVAADAIAPDANLTVRFNERHSVDTPDDELVYHAVVNVENDGDLTDNTTPQAKSTLHVTRLPAVDDLAAVTENSVNTLTWSQPVMPQATGTEPVTEDFEEYPSFAKADLDDWLLVDADGEKFAGYGNLSLPGINGPMAYFVLDNSHSDISYDPYGFLAAHSGNKYLASANTDGPTMASDDWLISPQVSQHSHEVSFWAKSYDSNYRETFEVLYSLESRAIADFKRISVHGDIPSDWTQYRVTLPEGTRYFAIRCLSVDKFMFFIDDITFTPMLSESEQLILRGYHVYRDGMLITDAPVDGTLFTDPSADPGKNATYAVRAIYAQGDSPLSNEVEVTTSALGALSADTVKIHTAHGNIIIDGADGMNITLSTVDGRTLMTVTGAPRTVLPAPSGILLVTVGNSTHKVAVK